jgi:ATPase subunit of ABC transporter with duplicated ATPase domains
MSTSIAFSRVSYAYPGSRPILESVDLELRPGWFGVVGRNGAGKTTLLRLASGELEPTAGRVARAPARLAIVHCPQDVATCDATITDFANRNDGFARELRGRLALDPERLRSFAALSPGERKRWQVATALGARPEVLLLDEPTNHLDAEARTLLIDALARFRGIGLLVSHDRDLLDALPERIVRVRDGRVAVARGGYGVAKATFDAADDAAARRSAALRERRDGLRTRLADARREQHSARRNASVAKRAKDVNDSDARGMLGKEKALRVAGKIGRRAEVARGALERVEDELRGAGDRERPLDAFEFGFAPLRRDPLVDLAIEELRLRLHRHDKVRIAGRNGAGKTTLLGHVAGALARDSDRVLHLEQDQDSAARHALRQRLLALDPAVRGRVVAIAESLGVDPRSVLDADHPSPGVARKVALALGLGAPCAALLLDEPTNHLDLPAIEQLQRALAAWQGALVLITHDDALAAACAATTLTLDRGSTAP